MLHNCLPRASNTDGISPYEAVEGKKPDFSMARVWGCLSYCTLRNEDDIPTRVSPTGVKAVHLGRDPVRNGWIVYIPSLKRITTTRDVTFDENKFLRFKSDGTIAGDPGDGYDDYPLDGEASALWAARGKASMPGVRNGSRPTGSLPKGRLSTDPPPKRNCWDCGRVVPDCHPFGNGNCDRKCGSWDKPGCGHGFCPGNQGKPCIVRLKAKFKFPDVLNGAGRPLPERFVQVLIESQEEWHKTAAKKAMVAEVAMVAEYYGVDEADAEATLKESGNDL